LRLRSYACRARPARAANLSDSGCIQALAFSSIRLLGLSPDCFQTHTARALGFAERCDPMDVADEEHAFLVDHGIAQRPGLRVYFVQILSSCRVMYSRWGPTPTPQMKNSVQFCHRRSVF